MKHFILILITFTCFNCKSDAQNIEESSTKESFEISKSDEEWKKILTSDQYYILRKAGTERPFSSPLNKNYKPGTYHCAGCKTPLFKSDFKFDSGTGWPSFDREIKGNVAFSTDNKIGYTRVEEHCATCGGHLGHVFNDGPTETGKRHCINGDALIFKPAN